MKLKGLKVAFAAGIICLLQGCVSIPPLVQVEHRHENPSDNLEKRLDRIEERLNNIERKLQ